MDVNIDQKVIDILSEISDKTPIEKYHNLQQDIGLDSLSLVMMLVAIEESFGIELEESDMNPYDFLIVQDIINLVKKYCGDKYA